MPRKDGMTTLKEIRYQNVHLPIIMLSGISSANDMAEAMETGANNYLTKPVSHEELRQAVDLLLPSLLVHLSLQAEQMDSGEIRLEFESG